MRVMVLGGTRFIGAAVGDGIRLLVLSSMDVYRAFGAMPAGTETDPHQALARSVAWHLANPPEDASKDFAADDRALAAAG